MLKMKLLQRATIYLILIASSIILIIYYCLQVANENVRKRNSKIQFYLMYKRNQSLEKPNIRVYDLKQPLENSISDSINCRQSAKYHQVSVLLCLHDKEKDVVSKALWKNGLWEEHIMRVFTFYVINHPDWLVIDIGAQIGQYSLMAAKLGARVIAIEPFYDNIVRLHKSALYENLTHQITLIRNALFDKRNQIKLLGENKINVGGQSLIENLDKRFQRSDLDKNKYLVETILLDDIIEYLPRSKNRQHRFKLLYEKAIIKIDIEGLEPYVLPMAGNLFGIISVQVIFMEWGKMPFVSEENRFRVKRLMDFLLEQGFVPFSIENMRLSLDKWASWPFDMCWIQKYLL